MSGNFTCCIIGVSLTSIPNFMNLQRQEGLQHLAQKWCICCNLVIRKCKSFITFFFYNHHIICLSLSLGMLKQMLLFIRICLAPPILTISWIQIEKRIVNAVEGSYKKQGQLANDGTSSVNYHYLRGTLSVAYLVNHLLLINF